VRILFTLLALPVLLLLCALAAYRVPLPAALGGSRDLVAAAAAGLLGLGYLAGLLAYLSLFLRRAGRALDPVLTPSGLVAGWEFPLGRRYSGTLDGRGVEVRYRPAYALQPARLDVTVDAQPGQRLAASAGPQRPLLDCRDCPRLDVPELGSVRVYARDEARARALLARPEAQAALVRLLDAPAASGTRELYLQPERVWFRARLRRVMEAEVMAWLDDVLLLAGAGERI
jgi:hypothetical protein